MILSVKYLLTYIYIKLIFYIRQYKVFNDLSFEIMFSFFVIFKSMSTITKS